MLSRIRHRLWPDGFALRRHSYSGPLCPPTFRCAYDSPRSHALDGLWIRTRLLPISVRAHVVFAASAAQAMQAGLALEDALAICSRVNTSARFRIAIERAAESVRAGDPLDEAFRASGFRIGEDFLAALAVGESRGNVCDELAAFATRVDSRTAALLPIILGRSPQAIHFAQAMARLLETHTMTPSLVRDASSLAPHSRGFQRAMTNVLDQFEGGASLGEAISCHPRFFDALYCRCVSNAQTRPDLRQAFSVLSRP